MQVKVRTNGRPHPIVPTSSSPHRCPQRLSHTTDANRDPITNHAAFSLVFFSHSAIKARI